MGAGKCRSISGVAALDRLIELDVGGIRGKIKDRWTELRSGILSEESMNEILQNVPIRYRILVHLRGMRQDGRTAVTMPIMME